MTRLSRIVTVVTLAVFLSAVGCAYFNVFFNAKKAYNKGYEAREKNGQGLPTAESDQNFNLAIRKASKVLELYPGSKWSDDALLLMGKSYFYMDKFPDAERTMKELIDNLPDSDLIHEARLYRAKALLKNNKLELAEAEMNRLIEADTGDKIKGEAYFGLADQRFFKGEYEEAIQQYVSLMDDISDKEILAEAQLRIAESYRLLDDYETAAAAYLKVSDFKPNDNIGYLSQFGYALTLQQLERYDEALDVLKEILDNSRYYSHLQDVFIEIARTHELKGDLEEAISVLERLNTVDLTAVSTAQNASQLLMSNPNTQNQEARSGEGADENRNSEENLGADNLGGKNRPDEVLGQRGENTENPEEGGLGGRNRSSQSGNAEALYYIGEIYLRKKFDYSAAKEYYTEAVRSRPEADLRSKIDAGISLSNDIAFNQIAIRKSVPKTPIFSTEPDSAVVPDSTRAVQGADLKRTGNIPQRKEQAQSAIDAVPVFRDSVEYRAALEKHRRELVSYHKDKASALYRVAELYLLEFANVDSSIVYIDRIFSETTDTTMYSKALFYKYNIYSSHDIPGAEALRDEIVNSFPGSDYALFFTGPVETDTSYVADAGIDSVEAMFIEAEKLLYADREYVGSIDRYLDIVEKYPDNDFAAKSLYSVGWMLETVLGKGELAVSVYERLQEEYPRTDYARGIKDKMSAVKAYRANQERLARLEERRQTAIPAAVTDSSAVIPDSTGAIQQNIQTAVSDSSDTTASALSDSTRAADPDTVAYVPIVYPDVDIPESLVYRIKGIPMPVDSSAVMLPDSLSGAVPDSLTGVAADSLTSAVADSMTGVVADSMSMQAVLPDTVLTMPDSTGLKPDTTAVKPDTTITPPDTSYALKVKTFPEKH